MQLVKRLAAAAALVLALAVPAIAQTAEQRDALAARIAGFDAAMRTNDMSVIMGVVPPKVLEKLAAQFGVTTEQAIESAQQQLDQAMQTVKLVSFGMDLAATEFLTLSDGTLYALIPTETVMQLGETDKIRATSTTLGLLDEGTWYLVRVEDPQQVALVKEIYPAFADVTFPTGAMEPVAE